MTLDNRGTKQTNKIKTRQMDNGKTVCTKKKDKYVLKLSALQF